MRREMKTAVKNRGIKGDNRIGQGIIERLGGGSKQLGRHGVQGLHRADRSKGVDLRL